MTSSAAAPRTSRVENPVTADPPPTHGDRRLVPTIAWAALLVVFALAALLVAFERAMHFDGVPIDGPFQLYNALRRIAAGFRPGVVFDSIK